MALYNKVSKDELEQNAIAMANEVERIISKIEFFNASLAPFDVATLNGLGVDADYQANLGSLKSDLTALAAWYRANTTFVRRFSKLTVF